MKVRKVGEKARPGAIIGGLILVSLALGGCGGATDLALGEAIERSLDPSARHRYRLVVPGPFFIRYEAEQHGVDIALTLRDGEGEELVRVDSPTTPFGPETLSWLAVSGRYTLTVEAVGRAAPGGRYRLGLVALRSEHPGDAERVLAETVFTEAGTAHWQGTASSLRQALDGYERAALLFAATDQPRQEAWARLNLEEIRANIDDRWSAIRAHETTLAAFRDAGDEAGVAETLGTVAYNRELLGDKQEAAALWRQALDARRRQGDLLGEANVLHNLAAFHASLGDVEAAEDGYLEALAIMRRIDDQRGAVYTLTNLGALARKSGQYDRALEHLEEALALHREAQDVRATGRALTEIGVLHSALGRGGQAAEDLTRARAAFARAGSRGEEAVVLAKLAGVLASLERHHEARAAMDEALALARLDGAPYFESEVLSLAAEQAHAAGRPEAAWALVSRSLDQIESIRARVSGRGWRASYLASMRASYALAIDVLTAPWPETAAGAAGAAQRLRRALDISERFRARNLLDHLRAARADLRQGIDPALLEGERALRLRVDQLAGRLDLGADADAAEAEDVRASLDQAVHALRGVEADIRHASPRYAALTQARPSRHAAIQQLLDPDTVLVVYWLGEQRSHAWVVGRQGIDHTVLGPRDAIEAAARALHGHLVARNRAVRFETEPERERRVAAEDAAVEPAASALARLVVEPIDGRLEGRRVAVVADGALRDVPFAVLPWATASAPEIVHLPSASVLDLLRLKRQGRPPTTTLAAVIADPVFGTGDPRLGRGARMATHRWAPGGTPGRFGRLPFTRQEAEALVRLAGGRPVFRAMGFDASRDTLLAQDLGSFRILHFATHALTNAKHPDLSGIVFSLVDAEGRPQDGFLRLRDIYNLELGADLVVLSACRTAAAGASQGAGLTSLARGFMYAGASRVLASLWEIDDQATAHLMERFYRGLLIDGLTPAAALAAAQAAMRSGPQWRAPYFWAGFVLEGDWR